MAIVLVILGKVLPQDPPGVSRPLRHRPIPPSFRTVLDHSARFACRARPGVLRAGLTAKIIGPRSRFKRRAAMPQPAKTGRKGGGDLRRAIGRGAVVEHLGGRAPLQGSGSDTKTLVT